MKIYTGNTLEITRKIPAQNGFSAQKINPYLPSESLKKAVNLAMILERPLLLMGDPGCGKSKLAQALAYELYHVQKDKKVEQDYRTKYEVWNITSTSKAKDGLYEFDAIARLRDAQSQDARAKHKKPYIQLRQLGKAIKYSTLEHRIVLLIDEIDKADIDFPNDLLNELDNAEFVISETGERVEAQAKPIVIITSNAERDLPDAFLRRCLFHRIEPFTKDFLAYIIRKRFYKDAESLEIFTTDFIKKAVEQFVEIRKLLESERISVSKNISVSELIDWFKVLRKFKNLPDTEDSAELKAMKAELEKLGKGFNDIPFYQILLKNPNSLALYKRHKNTN